MASSSELTRSRGRRSSLGVNGDADRSSEKQCERAKRGDLALQRDEPEWRRRIKADFSVDMYWWL